MNQNMETTGKITVCCGVDPGKLGALAVLFPNGDVQLFNFSEKEFFGAISMLATTSSRAKVVVALEHVGGLPGQSAPAAFNFGDNFGYIRGLLSAFEIPYELVRPQRWKKEFGCTSDKNTSIEVARRLFPRVNLKRTERCKKDDDGRAEALLLAEYARRHMA